MIVVLLLLSITGYVATLLGMGALSKRLFKNNADQLYFQLIRNVVCLILMVVIYKAIFPSRYTFLLSAAMGVALLISGAFSIVSYQLGPVSISVLVSSSIAMVLSALAGPVVWGEMISIWQVIGIVLSVLSMVLLTEKELIEKTSLVWVLAIVLAGIGGGMQGVIQKFLAMSDCASESNEFVTYSIFFSAIATALMLLVFSKKKNEKISFKMDGKVAAAFLLMSGLYIFLNINNLYLVANLPTIVFFPAYSIGGLLLTSVASVIMFKEKMSPRQIIGFVVGVVALLLISGTLEAI